MNKNVLVTGGAGFIGSSLSEYFASKGYNVKILDDFSRGKISNIKSIKGKFEIIHGDIKDKKVLSDALKNIDVVLHLAAINGTRFFYEIPHKVLDVNITGTLEILKSVSTEGISRFVFSSSSEVYGYPKSFPTNEEHLLQIMNPINPRFSYAVSKIAGESMVINFAKQFGFDYTILRLHNIYGPKMGNEHVIPEFIRRQVSNEKFIVQGDGTQIRSFCFISDATVGIFLASTRKKGANQIFNIGNDNPTSINDLIKLLSKIVGKKIVPVYNTKSKQIEGSTLRRQPDISKAQKLLDYVPEVSLENGLKITYQWYENHFKQSEIKQKHP